MAPKGGRGGGGAGGGGGSSVSVCPGAFWLRSSQLNLSRVVIILTAYLLLSFALWWTRMRIRAGKKLIGLPYIVAVVFQILAYILMLISAVLVECGSYNAYAFTAMGTVTDLCWTGATWLLLFVMGYVLYTMLRHHLGGVPSVSKAICLAILGFMLVLCCADVGLTSYFTWALSGASYETHTEALIQHWVNLTFAVSVLYLTAVFIFGAFLLRTISALRLRQHPASGLRVRIIILIFCMVMWNVMSLVRAGSAVANTYLTLDTREAIPWVRDFFILFSFIITISMAKHASWDHAATTAPMAQVYSPVRV